MCKCKVSIDGEVFETIQDAAAFLEITKQQLSKILLDKKECNVNGFVVKKLGKDRIVTKLMCIETGEVFNTMSALAESLGVSLPKISIAFQNGDCFEYQGKRYYRLSEKADIRINRQKGYKCQKRIEPVVTDVKEAHDDDKFLKVNLPESEVSEMVKEVTSNKKETAEVIIRNLVVQYVEKGDYDTANTLLKVLVKHGDELRN